MTEAGATDTTGAYIQQRLMHGKSRVSLRNIDISTLSGLAVKCVIDIVKNKGRHRDI